MPADGGGQVDGGVELTQVISATGDLSLFEAEVVDHLLVTVDQMHAKLTGDATFVVEAEVLSTIDDAARVLSRVRDLLQERMEPVRRAPRLLVDVMSAFDQVGVDRLRPDVLRRVLARLEQPRDVPVKALQRRLGAYGVPLRNNRTGLNYYRLADVQHVTGVVQPRRCRPQLLVEVDEFCGAGEELTVRRRDLKAALATQRPVLATISDRDFGSVLRPYGVTSYWRGLRYRIAGLQVRRALSRYDEA